MRISDWSSDVCSSDLHVLSTNFPAIRTHQQQTTVNETEPPNISIMADFQTAALLQFLPLQFDLSDAAAQRAIVQDSGAVAVIQNKSAIDRKSTRRNSSH